MTDKLKRCRDCNKILRPRNKSGLCHYHSILQIKNEKNSRKCFICKKISKHQMIIVINKKNRNFCTRHFNRLSTPYTTTQQQQKDLIRRLKELSL